MDQGYIDDDGNKYIGEILTINYEKFKHGKGIMIYKDGSMFKGIWGFDRYNGHGRKIQIDGTVYEGYYKEGKYHGLGKFIYENKNVFFGTWKQGKRSIGILKSSDGSIIKQGFWKNDELT